LIFHDLSFFFLAAWHLMLGGSFAFESMYPAFQFLHKEAKRSGYEESFLPKLSKWHLTEEKWKSI